MRPLFLFILLVSAALSGQAQSLYLYNVDATPFPRIRADYVAVDAIGRQYPTLSAADFRMSEQAGSGVAVDVTASITHGCRSITRDSAASILLIVDESMSMSNTVNGAIRMDLVKSALRTFVGLLNFQTGTQVCIIGFSNGSRMACPWTGSQSILLDSINRLTPSGATNYESPFIGIPNVFDEFKKRPAWIPKTAIFLTDDQPNPGITNPQQFIDTVSSKAFEQSIVIHSISVSETFTNPTLATIVSRTGGTSQFGAEGGMNTMFELINYSVNTRTICYIEWKAPYGCSDLDRDRTAIGTLLRGNDPADTALYTAGAGSIAVVTPSTPLLELGSPAAGTFLDASVTFTASNLDLLVRGFTISPSTHFTVIDWDFPRNVINPPSPTNIHTFRKNVARTIRVRFTQGAIPAFHTAVLSLIGDPCTIVQPLRGGGTQVVVVTPNGGDVLTTCDTADIRWSGIPSDAPVRIESSRDGVTWSTIAAAAKGLSYRWLPTVKGLTYRIRITYVPAAEYVWMQHIGHTGIDTASSVAARIGGDKVYVTGWFSGTTQFAGSPVSFPQGATDGFCQEFDGDGLWGRTFLVTGENGKNERVIGAVVDDKGNVYIAGWFESTTATLTGGTANYIMRMPAGQSGSVRDISNMFLARISPAGVIDWVRFGQGSTRYASEATATSIGIMKNARGKTQVVVGGSFASFINVGNTKNSIPQELGPALPPGPYYAAYDEFGNVVEVFARTPPTTYQYASKSTADSAGCTFEVDHFTGSITKGPFSLTARSASTDVYIARKCLGPTAIDVSNADFIVRTPFLTVANATLTVKPTIVGTSATTTFVQRICNTDLYPTRIADALVTGANASEFALAVPIAGRILAPNECIDIDVRFSPIAQGSRTATLTIVGDCGTLAAPALLGDGVAGCSLFVIGKVVMSDVVVGSTSTTSPCIVRNTTGADLTVSVRVQPAGTRFDVNPKGPIVLVPNQCFSPTITFDATTATPGSYVAALFYDLPAECGTVSSELQANVRDTTILPPKDSAISIADVDWFARRLRTVNDSVMYLTNTGAQDLTVESIVLGAVSGDITADLSTLPAMPFLLKSTLSIAIPIRFTPTVRGPHSLEVVATVRGVNALVKGLARGTGILPAMVATGDTWPVTPLLSVAAKTGNVVIRNTDPTTSLRIDNVVFVRPTQSDFRWAVPSATLFPTVIPPNGTLSIPVQFVPQASGIRSEFVRIYHDAVEGPGVVPPYADTTVELLGIGQSPDALLPLDFPKTLTCDTAVLSFWVPNNTATPFDITGIIEADPNNAFEVLGVTPITIPSADSVLLFVRFTPSASQTFVATFNFTNTAIPGLSLNVSGEGTTTDLTPSFPVVPTGLAGGTIDLPVRIRQAAPYFDGLTQMIVELLYPARSAQYQSVQVDLALVSIVSEDFAVPGRVVYTLAINAPSQQDIVLTARFRTLLSADSIINVTTKLSTAYTCVNTLPAEGTILVTPSCAGSSRVVNVGASAFALAQPYPMPASDNLTIRYATGYVSAATFEIVDAIGNIVRTLAMGEQPSAEYEVDVPVQDLAAGTYALRMTSGHYVQSRIFSVVR